MLNKSDDSKDIPINSNELRESQTKSDQSVSNLSTENQLFPAYFQKGTLSTQVDMLPTNKDLNVYRIPILRKPNDFPIENCHAQNFFTDKTNEYLSTNRNTFSENFQDTCPEKNQPTNTKLNEELTIEVEQKDQIKPVILQSQGILNPRPDNFGLILSPPANLTENTTSPNQAAELKIWQFKNAPQNYKNLTPVQKFLMFFITSIVFAGYIAGFVFIFKDTIVPRLKSVTRFQFFCAAPNTLTEMQDTLCFISLVQLSFGVISIGQISVGIVTLGQICLGTHIIACQVGLALIIALAAQVVGAPVIFCRGYGMSFLWARFSLFAVSPLSPLFRSTEKYPVISSCN